jgi:hypothetical protein
MKTWIIALALVCAALAPQRAAGQTRADSAAVLLHAAEQLRLQGDPLAARALLEYLQRQYAGTAAAVEAQRLGFALRRVQPAPSVSAWQCGRRASVWVSLHRPEARVRC